jgi:hypothetical protein
LFGRWWWRIIGAGVCLLSGCKGVMQGQFRRTFIAQYKRGTVIKQRGWRPVWTKPMDNAINLWPLMTLAREDISGASLVVSKIYPKIEICETGLCAREGLYDDIRPTQHGQVCRTRPIESGCGTRQFGSENPPQTCRMGHWGSEATWKVPA